MRESLVLPHLLVPWLFLVFFLAAAALAQQLPVRTYGMEDGLAGDSITDVVQDNRGYVWFATTDGVSRFDGERFTSYGTADGLPHARVNALRQSRDGTRWVATQGGLARFNPERPPDRPAFERVALGAATPEPIFSLYEDRAGRLWAGGDGRLFLIATNDGRKQVREIGLQGLPSVPGPIPALAETLDGSLWAATRQGLLRRLPDGGTIVYPVLPHFGHDPVRDLAVDRDGRLWIVHGLHVFVLQPEPGGRAEGGRPATLNEAAKARGCAIQPGRPASLPQAPGEVCILRTLTDSEWRRVQVSQDGRVRLASNRGLALWDGRRGLWSEESGLAQHSLSALAEDRDGNLWLGTEDRGAMRVARHGFVGFTASEGLANPQVASIFEGSDGALYVHSGNTFEGALWLHRFDGSRLKAVRPRLPPGLTYLGWSLSQTALLDRSGRWWLPTGEGLLRYPAVARFADLASTLPAVYTTRDGLGHDGIERLFEDSRGDLWIGTDGERTLSRWSRATGEIRSWGRGDGLPAGKPSALAEDASGQVWIGFSKGGLLRYRTGPGTGRFELLGVEQGLPEGPVRDLYVDRKGGLWVATEGSGMGWLQKPAATAPRFARLTTAEGLSSNEIRCLTEDRWGRIYLGGHKGIDRLDPRTRRIEQFTTADGLASNRVDVAFRDREGRLWFGTRHGISRLEPVREPLSVIPSPWITAVRVDGVPLRVSELGSVRVTPGIELESKRSSLEIEFVALSFVPGESLRYRTYLEGFDHQWSRPTSARSVVYAQLPAGRFRFQVQAVGPEGKVASVVPAEVLLVVRPPLWRRAWFLGLAVLAALAAGYLLHRYRVSHLVAMERMRTRIATDLHDDLGSSLSRISILSELARRRAETDPEGSRLLTDIGETAREMMESLGESIWAIDPRRDNLRSLVTRIRRFAGDLLEAHGMAWHLHAPADAEQVRLSPVERRQLYLIFKEALHNAARHSGASSVDMTLALDGRRLTATIRDDGKGFTPPTYTDTVGRHGLPSMAARAAELKGRLEIDSAPGRGTELRLDVPLSSGNA
jgi:signal transduction histidine kinase/ligand-binding sensor domain-containing protein